MTGMMFNKAPFIFVVKKYSGESKNDRNEVDWSKIHCFSVNIQEHAKMTGMMFMMKHCPYFLQANIQEKAKMTGMKLRKWLKQHPYFLSENIQENAKMTGMMFNEASLIFFVKKYSWESKNDRNEVDWNKIHIFCQKIFRRIQNWPEWCSWWSILHIFCWQIFRRKQKMTGMKLRSWLKQHPYFLSENIQENAKMTGIMFNEPSSIFFVRKYSGERKND